MIYSFFFAFVMLLFLVVSVRITPKNPGFFGYKTKRSIKNGDTWGYANKMANRLMFFNIVVLLLLSSVLCFIGEEEKAQQLPFVVFSVLSIAVIPVVEYQLKKKFDKNGNRK